MGGGRKEGSGWGGVRVDVIEELMFLGKFTNKFIYFLWGGGLGRGGGVELGVGLGGSGWMYVKN